MPSLRTVLLLLAWLSGPALAQPFPAKPIRLLITFSAGGQADLLARAVTDKMTTGLGQPVVIESRPGAGGNLAMEAVAKSAPDGYSLVFGTPAVAINGTLYKNLSFDPIRDLVPISLAAWGPYALYTSGTLPISSVAELIAHAKARPGLLNFASVGVGSGTHLAAVLFSLASGISLSHVPYKGIQQAAPDLVSGQVHLTFNAIGPLQPFVTSGKIKLMANTGSRRLAGFAEVPTIAETVPGFSVGGWYGFFAPANTPREILQRLNGEIVRALNQPDLAERIEKLALFATPQTLEEASRFVTEESAKWRSAVLASGASAE